MRDGLCIVLPVRDDYQSLTVLLEDLSHQVDVNATKIVIVDDGSNNPILSDSLISSSTFEIFRIDTVLKRGSQAAIFQGISYASLNFPKAYIIVMDADGEDLPADIPKLLNALQETSAIVARAVRGKRHTSYQFRLFYRVFQLIFFVLTGQRFNTGNFMAMSPIAARTLLRVPESTWNLNMAVQRYLPNTTSLTLNRGKRIYGKSKMNFTSLLRHGYSAISVYADIVLLRLIIFSSISSIICVLMASVYIIAKLIGFLNLIPGWTSIIVLQLLSLAVVIMFLSLIAVLTIFKSDQGFVKEK